MAAKNPSLYRAMHHLRKGGLHRALHVPEGENISEEQLSKAENSSNKHLAAMGRFARTMRSFKH